MYQAALSTVGEDRVQVSRFLSLGVENDGVCVESSCGEDFLSYEL